MCSICSSRRLICSSSDSASIVALTFPARRSLLSSLSISARRYPSSLIAILKASSRVFGSLSLVCLDIPLSARASRNDRMAIASLCELVGPGRPTSSVAVYPVQVRSNYRYRLASAGRAEPGGATSGLDCHTDPVNVVRGRTTPFYYRLLLPKVTDQPETSAHM